MHYVLKLSLQCQEPPLKCLVEFHHRQNLVVHIAVPAICLVPPKEKMIIQHKQQHLLVLVLVCKILQFPSDCPPQLDHVSWLLAVVMWLIPIIADPLV